MIKLLEENRVENLYDLWFGKEFLDMTPKRWPMKEKWVNWTSSELKPFALWNALFWEWKDKLHTARKYLAIIYFTKDSVKPGSIKHSQNSTARIQPNWNMGKRLEQVLDQLSLLDHLQSASLELTLGMRRTLRKMHWIIHLSTVCQSFILFSKLLFSLDCLHLCEILGRDSSPHLAGSITETLGGQGYRAW